MIRWHQIFQRLVYLPERTTYVELNRATPTYWLPVNQVRIGSVSVVHLSRGCHVLRWRENAFCGEISYVTSLS